jgi:esterase
MKPEDRWINLSSLKLHYLDWGNSSAQPMVLLHGYCSYARYWDFFARNMKQDYHVLAPDLRGHGDSGRAQAYTLQEGAQDIEELFSALKLKNMVLLGLSMGGLIAMYYAAIFPERLSKLIIVDIGPDLASEGIEHIVRDLSNEPEYFNSEDEAFHYLKKVQPFHADEFLKHQAHYGLQRDEAGRLKFKYDKALCCIELQSQDWLWDYLKKISCLTLVIRAADSDMLLKETAQKMMAKLPNGSLVEVPHATHNIVGDNPEGFEKAVRKFLGQ